MYLFKSKVSHLAIKLSANDVSLLHTICDLGFVSKNQLDMVYSITQGYPAMFSHHILHNWCKYSGLLHKYSKSNKSTASALPYSAYVPTPACRRFLISIGIPLGKDPLVSLNSHNLEAIEVVVQGLYAAVFKYSAYNSSASSLVFSNTFSLLEHPEETFSRSKPDTISKINQISQIYPVHSDQHSEISQMEKQSEKTARNTQHQGTGSIDTRWINKQYSRLKYYLTLPIDKALPIVTKSLYDSAIQGDITPKQVDLLCSKHISDNVSVPTDTKGSNDNKTTSTTDVKELLSSASAALKHTSVLIGTRRKRLRLGCSAF